MKSHDPNITLKASPHIPLEANRIKLAAEETLEAPEPRAPAGRSSEHHTRSVRASVCV